MATGQYRSGSLAGVSSRDANEFTSSSRFGSSRSAQDAGRVSITELEDETGVTSRTIRYYVSQGMLPPAYGRGPTATYDYGHLLRLQMIVRLKEDGLSLAEIKDRLANLGDEEIASMLRIQTRPPEDRWRRVTLHPGLELHVREPGGDVDIALEEAAELLIKLARPVIERLEGR